jgi:signal transduction histidine kinase
LITLDVPRAETPDESLDRLRMEVADLRASRERLALAADRDRRRIEHDLHDGPQQHLVALAANLQLARLLVDTDLDATRTLLDELGGDVQQALDETAKLAHRIYPPLLETGGLAAALRTAAVILAVPTRVGVAASADYPQEVAGAVYFCCLAALENAGDGASAAITVQDENGAVVFEVAVERASATAIGEALNDRVEALGGRLTVQSSPGGRARLLGSLPLSR